MPDRRIQEITFGDFIPCQMKTVMHSLNDLRVLLSDPFTQVHVLEALKEDKFNLGVPALEMKTRQTDKEQYAKDEDPLEKAEAQEEAAADLGL